MKKKKLSDSMQRVACDILNDFIIASSGLSVPESVQEVYETWFYSVFERYELCDCPFTGLPCTTKEYLKNSLEYEKQLMIEKYGHCDGLD